jgi:hypothetical protein
MKTGVNINTSTPFSSMQPPVTNTSKKVEQTDFETKPAPSPEEEDQLLVSDYSQAMAKSAGFEALIVDNINDSEGVMKVLDFAREQTHSRPSETIQAQAKSNPETVIKLLA